MAVLRALPLALFLLVPLLLAGGTAGAEEELVWSPEETDESEGK